LQPFFDLVSSLIQRAKGRQVVMTKGWAENFEQMMMKSSRDRAMTSFFS
jgi:hypothetical protein